MDISTIFPEMMTLGIRQNGDPRKQDPRFDETAKYGRNYYFPDGFLKNVHVTSSGGYFVYRRPHNYYDSYEGDEMNLFENFDITFKLPPVPYEGEWQVRMGYAQEPTRGIAQFYLDGKPQGIPLDMTVPLSDAKILGAAWPSSDKFLDWVNKNNYEELSNDQKALKNKGYYRGALGGQRYSGENNAAPFVRFAVQQQTFRRVIYTGHLTADEDHYLRIRCVSAKQGNKNEFMLDYFELVPKSVYGVTDEGQIENML
jgi:hypothetical protein